MATILATSCFSMYVWLGSRLMLVTCCLVFGAAEMVPCGAWTSKTCSLRVCRMFATTTCTSYLCIELCACHCTTNLGISSMQQSKLRHQDCKLPSKASSRLSLALWAHLLDQQPLICLQLEAGDECLRRPLLAHLPKHLRDLQASLWATLVQGTVVRRQHSFARPRRVDQHTLCRQRVKVASDAEDWILCSSYTGSQPRLGLLQSWADLQSAVYAWHPHHSFQPVLPQ